MVRLCLVFALSFLLLIPVTPVTITAQNSCGPCAGQAENAGLDALGDCILEGYSVSVCDARYLAARCQFLRDNCPNCTQAQQTAGCPSQ